jgi:hypothetical protein
VADARGGEEALDRKLEAPDDPLLVYRLATQVPAHWIPLVPKSSGGAANFKLTLQRRGMARFYSLAPALMVDPTYSEFIAMLRKQDDFIEERDTPRTSSWWCCTPEAACSR